MVKMDSKHKQKTINQKIQIRFKLNGNAAILYYFLFYLILGEFDVYGVAIYLKYCV